MIRICISKAATVVLVCAAIGLTMSGQSAFAQSVDQGEAALRAGNVTQARDIWEENVATGDAAAMRNLARLHYTNSIMDADLERAHTLLSDAVAQGNGDANLDLGYLYQNGIGVPQSLARAEAFYSKASQAGNLEAAFLHARLVLGRKASPTETRQALAELKATSDAGHPPAVAAVGDLFRTGTFLVKDVEKAIEYYTFAAEKGDLDALNTIGDIYAFAELGVADIDQAATWYERAAAQGNAASAYSLALVLYSDPEANDTDLARAFDYAQIAALAWNEGAQFLLGRMYLEDRATIPDPFEAYRWLDLAASANVFEAHHYRAIAGHDLGPERAQQAHESAAQWFTENHATPHIHRLLSGNYHSFN